MVGRIQRKDNNGEDKKPIKRKKAAPVVSSTGVTVEECYCRKCRKFKKSGEFYKATDINLDTNGFMSVCKECISDIYVRVYSTEHTIERALLRVCRMINLKYSEAAITVTSSQLNTQGKDPSDPSVVGIYKSKLIATQKTEMSKRDMTDDFTFVEPSSNRTISDQLDDSDESYDLKDFWGEGIGNIDDYEYLKKEYKNLSKYHTVENYAEIILAKEVCFKLLELKRARIELKATDKLVKDLQELMKNLAISPNMANIANQGKNKDTFGDWIKEIEKYEPAEWWDTKREKYIDINGWGKFAKNHIIRTIKNTLGLTKNFTLTDDAEETLEDEDIEYAESE
jgi:hypothetical protein